MRTLSRILAVTGLVAFCRCAVGQGVTQTNDTVRFTFTDIVTRVPVHLPVWQATGLVGPNLLCHSQTTAPINAQNSRVAPSASAADLRGGLLGQVVGKSAGDLARLLAAVQNASGRDAKVRELFGIAELSNFGGSSSLLYRLDNAQVQLLQMGQEVTGPTLVVNSPTASASGSEGGVKCYSTQQIDQAIAEGTRVVSAIIQAMSASASTPSKTLQPALIPSGQKQ